MMVMLAFIFGCILLGLLSPRLGQRQSLVVTVFAITMTVLYYLFPARLV
ncbi:MAG: hypothetical protein IT305_24070 [Chloroflexi bacterium]|nr:hypothetical protein [Chloroflexota bacterium]